jgi:subtilisin family serine protease
MWLLIFFLLSFALGGELKVLYHDGRVGVVSEQALKSLKSQLVYTEKPKRLWLKDEILRSSSIGIWVRGSKSYSLPVRAGQTIGFSTINASVSFSGPCSQSGNILSCFSEGSLNISASSSDGRLLLWSETHPLSLLPDSYWLGTSARLSGRTGRGVLAVVVDTGIDLCHPEFEDRIVLFYDATSGLELDQNAIRQRRQSGDCDYDFGGHGTAVAGVLAGKNGIAPGASIVAVKVVSSIGAIDDATVMRALEYIKSKRQQLGMPMVVNISLGNTLGPADGTSLLDLFIDQNSGPGTIVVAAAGNEGHLPLRAVIQEATFVSVPVSLSPGIPFEVWYGGSSSYRVELCDSSGRCAVSQRGSPPTLNLSCVNSITHQSYPLNGKVYVEFDHNCSGSYTLKLTLTSGGPSRVDLFGGFEGNSFGAYTVSDGQGGYLYTVAQPATARRAIAVGAFTSKALSSGSPAFNSLGMLAFFSSRGPTVDGRTKPDISAGGYVVYVPQEMGGYAYEAGTSFSTPAVAGLVALMLEANPSLIPEQAKELLCQNALRDSAVGSVPNNFFGCGKAQAVMSVSPGSGGQTPPSGGTLTTSGGGGGCSTGSAQYLWVYGFVALLLVLRRFKGKPDRMEGA